MVYLSSFLQLKMWESEVIRRYTKYLLSTSTSVYSLIFFRIFPMSCLQDTYLSPSYGIPLAPSLRAPAPQSAPAPAGSPLVHLCKDRAHVSKSDVSAMVL